MQCILGIDPGLCNTGWALLEVGSGDQDSCDVGVKIVEVGLIKTPTKDSLSARLQFLHLKIAELRCYNPELVIIEEGYCGVDGRSALKLGMVRGAILTAFCGTKVEMYSPASIKKQVIGKGDASKQDAADWVALHFPGIKITSQDVVDAVIIGLTGAGGSVEKKFIQIA